jgi:nucleotide-binding universal stress UspA family protein
MTKILVPVDGSLASIRAVKFAIAQVKRMAGASLVIVNIQNAATLGLPATGENRSSAQIEQEVEIAATEALQDAVILCRQAKIPYATRSGQGDIATTIDHVAREEHVAQIIMGTRGLGTVSGLVLGSVSTQVLHLADVPVTLVK